MYFWLYKLKINVKFSPVSVILPWGDGVGVDGVGDRGVGYILIRSCLGSCLGRACVREGGVREGLG